MKSNKTNLTHTWFLVVAWLLVGCARPTPESVILIVVDTLRADHLGMYGYERPTSTHLDSLAAQGVVFDNAVATSPWTLPTFGSILTGRLPSAHGAGEPSTGKNKPWRTALRDSISTLPEVLRDEGWDTAAVVSNPFLKLPFGLSRGFDTYDYKRFRTADRVVDRTLEILNQLDQNNFFLMVHIMDPHLPYLAPEPYRGLFVSDQPAQNLDGSRKLIRSLMDQLTEDDWDYLVARYDEEIAFVDAELERLFDELRARDLLTQSLVVLTSDHGEEFLEHGDFEHGHSMFQELLRVPLVMWGPGLEGRRDLEPFSLVDLAQTIFTATQGQSSPDLSGVSHWKSLYRNRKRRHQTLVAETPLWIDGQKVVIDWPFKLILDPKSTDRQLFNLETDPGETKDLANSEQARADQLESDLRDRLSPTGSEESRKSLAISEETESELRSLGYLD